MKTVHVYEVMAEPIRRRIVEMLASGPHDTGDIEAVVVYEFGVTRSAVHHHLRLFREHGYVTVTDDWPRRTYQLSGDLIESLARQSAALEEKWRHRIGWNSNTDPLAPFRRYSRRGHRGLERDPDDPQSHRRREHATAEATAAAESYVRRARRRQ